MIQSSVKKETAGRISLFTIPMKATPTKPAHEPSAKCSATTSATVQCSGVNNLTTASPASQLTPRCVMLLPPKTNQPITYLEDEQENQVPSKHVQLTPAKNNQKTKTDKVKPAASQVRCDTLTVVETRSETENTNKLVGSDESTNLCQSHVPVSSTPRRIQLTTLSSDVGIAVQQVTLQQDLKVNPSFHQPDHKVHQPTSQEGTTIKQDSSTLAKPEPMEIQLKSSTEGQPTQVKVPLPLVENQESVLVPLKDLDTSKTHSHFRTNSTQLSRMTLKSLNVETSQSNSNQVDKENGSNSPLLGHNSQLKPKRVALVTLGTENRDQNVSSENNNSSPHELQLSSRKPIPLEPIVIVLDDD